MGKAELGTKLTCDSCGARFYDLNKTPALCPKCGTANAKPVVFKSRGGGRPQAPEEREEKRAAAQAAAAAPKAKPVDDEDAGPEADDDDEDEAVIEDTSDLGEDDDVGVAVEKDEPT